MSPKTIAPVGHTSAHAGVTAPSLSLSAESPARVAAARAARMRCTQKEHFSITPLLLTVTSGLKLQFMGSGTSLNPNQLKTRTL